MLLKIERLILIFILFSLLSCSLFNPTVYEVSKIMEIGEIIADSIEVEPGFYSIFLNSDYVIDIFFFSSRKGLELFKDSSKLYSEYLEYPLTYVSKSFMDERFYIFEDKKLYFVIDNSDLATKKSGKPNIYFKIGKE
uniref:Lipoprotein n=1 Tax=candidate division WOR-3 bacterium TaxID=2052148 RepID=A0A7C3N802_UNCW3